MSTISELLRGVRTITFDCYGTLIDWKAGLRRFLGEVLGPAAKTRGEELFAAYVRTEAVVESEAYQSYRSVLTCVVERLAVQFNVDLPPGRAAALPDMLPNWAPFADTNEALKRLKRRFQLGVLSNIDRDLFAKTARHFDVSFDFVVTAEDARSYKPGYGHFKRLIGLHGGPDGLVHVAQSLFHDGIPASEFGLAFVWINRYGQKSDGSVPMIGEYPDLASFADAACGEEC